MITFYCICGGSPSQEHTIVEDFRKVNSPNFISNLSSFGKRAKSPEKRNNLSSFEQKANSSEKAYFLQIKYLEGPSGQKKKINKEQHLRETLNKSQDGSLRN